VSERQAGGELLGIGAKCLAFFRSIHTMQAHGHGFTVMDDADGITIANAHHLTVELCSRQEGRPTEQENPECETNRIPALAASAAILLMPPCRP
jgi:hypothetical protein